MSDEFDDLIAGGDSIPSAILGEDKPVVKGFIVAKAVNNARVFNSNEVKTWKDGSPIKQLVITLATEERDPRIPDDDGRRKIYAEQDRRPGAKFAAIQQSVKDAGAPKMELGGVLAVAFIGRDPESPAAEKRKMYRAQYQAPAEAAADDLLGAAPAPVAAAQPPAAPAPVQPVVAASSLI